MRDFIDPFQKCDCPRKSHFVLDHVMAERFKQDEKWGVQNHSLHVYYAILAEECGEVAKAINDHRFGKAPLEDVRKELVQTAAVAIAMIESLDRNGG